MNDKDRDEFFKFVTSDQVEMVPDDRVLPGTDYHVCMDQPIIGAPNLEATCHKCGGKVYYGNDRPTLKKLCNSCFLAIAKTEKVQCYGNPGSVYRLMLRQAMKIMEN